jgi:hypothetical protein
MTIALLLGDKTNMAKKNSNYQATINSAVIRNDIGRLQVHLCHGKITEERQLTRQQQDFNNKTVGDILNRLQYNNSIRAKILRDSK